MQWSGYPFKGQVLFTGGQPTDLVIVFTPHCQMTELETLGPSIKIGHSLARSLLPYP
jgi:hypothetical protein